MFYCCINGSAHMLLILPWVHTFSTWVNRAVRVWPVIECDCALHVQWSSELLSSESSCSVTVSAASLQSDMDRYPHRVPLITCNTKLVSCCLCSKNIREWIKYVHIVMRGLHLCNMFKSYKRNLKTDREWFLRGYLLSKLFLPTFKQSYSDFGETCQPTEMLHHI